jgi:hypothetical protein
VVSLAVPQSFSFSGAAFPRTAFYEHGVVHAITQSRVDGVEVWRESVRRQLERLRCGRLAYSFDENVSRRLTPSTQCEIQKQFGVMLDCEETVGVTNTRRSPPPARCTILSLEQSSRFHHTAPPSLAR